jgi:hypothetical protein
VLSPIGDSPIRIDSCGFLNLLGIMEPTFSVSSRINLLTIHGRGPISCRVSVCHELLHQILIIFVSWEFSRNNAVNVTGTHTHIFIFKKDVCMR